MSASSDKHRHDVGHPDHGPESTESTTIGIQLALGLAIAASLALVIYLLAIRGGH